MLLAASPASSNTAATAATGAVIHAEVAVHVRSATAFWVAGEAELRGTPAAAAVPVTVRVVAFDNCTAADEAARVLSEARRLALASLAAREALRPAPYELFRALAGFVVDLMGSTPACPPRCAVSTVIKKLRGDVRSTAGFARVFLCNGGFVDTAAETLQHLCTGAGAEHQALRARGEQVQLLVRKLIELGVREAELAAAEAEATARAGVVGGEPRAATAAARATGERKLVMTLGAFASPPLWRAAAVGATTVGWRKLWPSCGVRRVCLRAAAARNTHDGTASAALWCPPPRRGSTTVASAVDPYHAGAKQQAALVNASTHAPARATSGQTLPPLQGSLERWQSCSATASAPRRPRHGRARR